MQSERYITLKCGTTIRLADLEAAGLSYVPCGQFDGEDQPLFPYAHFWGNKQQVTLTSYGRKANAWTLNRMTGVQLMTGAPTYRSASPVDHHLVDIDIEKHLIDEHPEIVDRVLAHYRAGCQGNLPCIVETKSGGLRLSAFCPYLDRKRAFEDEGGMLLEIFSEKGLSRLDGRYAMLEGSVLNIPTLPKSVLQEIHAVISEIVPEKVARTSERTVVAASQIGDLNIEWDKEGRSQFFSAQHCQATSHKSTRNTVRFTKHADGSVDGKCFNCGETWWEMPPKIDQIIAQAPPPIDIYTPSFRHWTAEERIVVKEILGVSPDAGWHEGTPAFATRYENLYPITGAFALNGQPSEVEKRRVWSTNFGRCEKCGDVTADWVDRYLLTAGRYCNSCHTDTPIGSYLEWELSRKLPNSIVSAFQGFLGDDPEFEDFRLWQPEMLTHLGAGMATGKSTEIYKALVSLALQNLGRGIIASPRISLTRFLAHQLRKRHGHRAWGLWHEGSGREEQYIGTYGAIVCLPSLDRAVAAAYDAGLDASSLYVAIDEIDFGYSLLSLAVHQAAAVKKCLLDIFLATGLVVSGQTESTLALEAFASELGCEHIQGFYNTAPPADGIVQLRKYPDIEGKNAIVLAGSIESIEIALRAGHNVYVFCTARRDADVIAERFAEQAPVVYNAFTKGDTRCDAVLKNQRLPEGSRLFIGTSAAGVGISILDPKARTIRVGGLTYGSRDASMGVQTTLRDRGRRGIEWHYADYNFALPMRPRETENVSLYHERIKQLEHQYAHLSEDAVKKVARSLALTTLADHQLETFVQHHLGKVGNMEVVELQALLPEDVEVEWVTEQRRESIRKERETKCSLAANILKSQDYLTSREIRVQSNRGDFAQIEQIGHEYANGLASAVGWSDTDAEDPLNDAAIHIAVQLAEQHLQPERLAKIRRGYLAVHYPNYVTAVFEAELEETRSDLLDAGTGLELTAVTDDRFLGEVLKALLDRLKDEVFEGDDRLATAIREVLDTVSEGQTLFGRIKLGGLGTSAYRRARFLQIGSDAFVINWARTFIKEYYPATLSKRGDRYSLVHDKRIELILASIRCWLSKRVHGEVPELEPYFEQIDPQAEFEEKVRDRRKAGATLETIAAEFNMSVYKASEWCKDIKVPLLTETEKKEVRDRRKAGATLETIAAEFNVATSTVSILCKDISLISPAETAVLCLLEDGEVWKTSDIEKQSKFTRQRTTIAIRKLVEKELITKIKRGYYQKSGF
ncbi:MAG: hypothetical protein OXN27_25655 [Candidatus Poribacteria bacterium]|nr:hypothetical protein [Candidatus Poribacteria bacterium]